MTAVVLAEPGTRDASLQPPSRFARVWRIVRLHYANGVNSIFVPLNIAFLIFLVWLAVQGIYDYSTGTNTASGQSYSTALVYFLPYQVVFAVQAMNLTFAYALGLSSTRRDFSYGTWLMFLIQSAGFAVIFTAMSYLEQWTAGWGLHAEVFQSVAYGTGGVGQRLVTFFAGVLVCQCIGSVFGAAFVRWRTMGMYVISAAFLVAILGAVALITITQAWPAVGRWFVEVGPAGFSAWLLVPAALFAVIGHLALRRATPKS
ncbi:hypothetical protein [Gryllotalpicola koreensis]|uniref:ABC transporter permease n=1 Tax=Gryllotalpicola koreensis TaxID=993086 RepID=A0ABP8A2S9_9MICO